MSAERINQRGEYVSSENGATGSEKFPPFDPDEARRLRNELMKHQVPQGDSFNFKIASARQEMYEKGLEFLRNEALKAYDRYHDSQQPTEKTNTTTEQPDSPNLNKPNIQPDQQPFSGESEISAQHFNIGGQDPEPTSENTSNTEELTTKIENYIQNIDQVENVEKWTSEEKDEYTEEKGTEDAESLVAEMKDDEYTEEKDAENAEELTTEAEDEYMEEESTEDAESLVAEMKDDEYTKEKDAENTEALVVEAKDGHTGEKSTENAEELTVKIEDKPMREESTESADELTTEAGGEYAEEENADSAEALVVETEDGHTEEENVKKSNELTTENEFLTDEELAAIVELIEDSTQESEILLSCLGNSNRTKDIAISFAYLLNDMSKKANGLVGTLNNAGASDKEEMIQSAGMMSADIESSMALLNAMRKVVNMVPDHLSRRLLYTLDSIEEKLKYSYELLSKGKTENEKAQGIQSQYEPDVPYFEIMSETDLRGIHGIANQAKDETWRILILSQGNQNYVQFSSMLLDYIEQEENETLAMLDCVQNSENLGELEAREIYYENKVQELSYAILSIISQFEDHLQNQTDVEQQISYGLNQISEKTNIILNVAA